MLIGNERNTVEQMPSMLLNGSGDTSGIVEGTNRPKEIPSFDHTCVAY